MNGNGGDSCTGHVDCDVRLHVKKGIAEFVLVCRGL